jgi:hypothetical protein
VVSTSQIFLKNSLYILLGDFMDLLPEAFGNRYKVECPFPCVTDDTLRSDRHGELSTRVSKLLLLWDGQILWCGRIPTQTCIVKELNEGISCRSFHEGRLPFLTWT